MRLAGLDTIMEMWRRSLMVTCSNLRLDKWYQALSMAFSRFGAFLQSYWADVMARFIVWSNAALQELFIIRVILL